MYDIQCALIILYHHNKILLQKRTKDAPVLPDYWGYFGGGINPNESPKHAVIRETKEELGYILTNPTRLLDQEFYIDTRKGHMTVFFEEYQENRELICYEGEEFGWFQKSDISALKMKEHDKKVAYALFEKLGR